MKEPLTLTELFSTTPALFALLACFVTSTLTLAVIQDKIVDRKNQIKTRIRNERLDYKSKERLNNAVKSADEASLFLTWLIYIQLSLTTILGLSIPYYLIPELKTIIDNSCFSCLIKIFEFIFIFSPMFMFGFFWLYYYHNHGKPKIKKN